MRKTVLIGMVMALVATAGFAQDMFPGEPPQPVEVSDTELQQFAVALQQVEVVQQEVQSEMIDVLNGHDISTERFNELYQAQHDPNHELTEPIASDEQERFLVAEQELQGIQQDAQIELTQAVQSGGLEVERFNQIYVALTQDPELQQRIRQLMQ